MAGCSGFGSDGFGQPFLEQEGWLKEDGHGWSSLVQVWVYIVSVDRLGTWNRSWAWMTLTSHPSLR